MRCDACYVLLCDLLPRRQTHIPEIPLQSHHVPPYLRQPLQSLWRRRVIPDPPLQVIYAHIDSLHKVWPGVLLYPAAVDVAFNLGLALLDLLDQPQAHFAIADETRGDGDVELEDVPLSTDVQDVSCVGRTSRRFDRSLQLGSAESELFAVLTRELTSFPLRTAYLDVQLGLASNVRSDIGESLDVGESGSLVSSQGVGTSV